MTYQLLATLPVLVPLAAALAVLLLDAAVPRLRLPHLGLLAAGLLGGAAAAVPGVATGRGETRGAFCLETGRCLYTADRTASVLQLAAMLAACVVLALAWRDWSGEGEQEGRPAVLATLVLVATAGAAGVPAAGDLGSLLVALELATLPTVALIALGPARGTGAEAEQGARAVDGAVALLTTSLVSFALAALGAALWVLATGTALLDPETPLVAGTGPLLALGVVLLVAGTAFKLSAAPFHAWTPLTYTAAPLPVTTYLATVSKVAALGALVVVLRSLPGAGDLTILAVALLAALSMTVGNLVALVQEDAVRLLAWSTVAQAGWVLLPLASPSARAAQASASYLLIYIAATLLAFVAVAVVGDTRLAAQRALLRRRPLLTTGLGLALLTLAGLPPAIAGLLAKVVALRAVAGEGTWWLALAAAVNVAVGLAVYLRWFGLLLAKAPAEVPEGAADAAAGAAAGATDEAGAPVEGEDARVTRPPGEPVLLGLVATLALILVLASIVPVWVL